jgi:hypothetical protein
VCVCVCVCVRTFVTNTALSQISALSKICFLFTIIPNGFEVEISLKKLKLALKVKLKLAVDTEI